MSIGMRWLVWFLFVGGSVAVIALTSCAGGDTSTASPIVSGDLFVSADFDPSPDMAVITDLIISGPDLRLTCGGGAVCIRACADQPCVDGCIARSDNSTELAAWVKCVEGYCGQPIYQIMPADRCMQNQFEFARACWCHYYQCLGVEKVRDMGVAENCR